MNPDHNNYQSSPELPQLQADTWVQGDENLVSAAPETRGMIAITPATSTPLTPVPIINNPLPEPAQGLAGAAVATAASASGTAGLIADDADLIEKEWVMKAKAIVLQTKNDPHAQNLEMNKVKADYLKKRYNKDQKVSES